MLEAYSQILAGLEAESRLRSVPTHSDGVLTDFTGNDYLGIAGRRRVEREFIAALSANPCPPPFTSVASRLLASHQAEYRALEVTLSEAYGKGALLFNSGYHANTGCTSALALPGTLLVTDKLVHASIIDGVRMSGAPYRRFAHNDVAKLRRILGKEAPDYERIWVIVESIYSMDGDEAPLRELVELKREFPKMALYVDEAHGLGVRGSKGLGLAEEQGLLDEVDLLILTFGKACASMGAAALCSPTLRDFLLNSARSFIFSTAFPPVNAAYTRMAFRALQGMTEERCHLALLSEALRRGLEEITGQKNPSTSQIVPWMIGDNARAVEYARRLREAGVLAMPIRRPTVAAGTERIRFSLSAALSLNDIDRLLSSIKEIVRP